MAIERGLKAKVRYRVDEFIGGGAGKQLLFLALLTIGLIVVFTGIAMVLHLVVPVGPDPGDATHGATIAGGAGCHRGRVGRGAQRASRRCSSRYRRARPT